MIEISEQKRAAIEAHLELAAFEDAAVLIPQNREQHLIVQIGLERAPIDIEIGRIK